MTPALPTPVVAEFPLRGGPWIAYQTPARRVPSHGTDMLGQRYAYDFIKVDHRRGTRVHPGSAALGLLFGVQTDRFYAWGEPVYAPFDCEILAAVDDCPERSRVHPVRELAMMVKTAATFRPSRLRAVLGNHVIARYRDGVLLALAHFAPGSVAVRAGELVRRGDLLGRVGHSGNSTAPHLHLQLMDSADPLTAQGVLCAFASYEVLDSPGGWRPVRDGIPDRSERMRFRVTKDNPGP